jgi:integrase
MAFIQKIKTKKGYSYKVHYTDPITRQRRKKSFPRRKDADLFIQSPRLSSDPARTSYSFTDAADNWLEVCEHHGRKGRQQVARSTLRKYNSHAALLTGAVFLHDGIEVNLGKCRLSKLDKHVCKSLRAYLLECYSWRYARKILVSFKSIIAQAREDDLMQHSPEEFMFIKAPQRENQLEEMEKKFIEPSEARLIFETAKRRTLSASDLTLFRRRFRYWLIIETIGYGGTRPGEAMGLPWKNVDFQRGGILITQDADEGRIDLPKTTASFRFIPMPSHYMRRLCYWRELCRPSQHDLVFPSEKSGNVDFLSNFNARGWKPVLRAAGLANEQGASLYPPKSLRHYRASVEINNGANPKEVMTLMGHSSIRVTFDIYGHLFKEQDKARAARAERVGENDTIVIPLKTCADFVPLEIKTLLKQKVI